MINRSVQLAVIVTLCSWISFAQTRSDCEPSPQMPPNVKPGVSGLTLSRDGKTLLVAAGDGKIRFVDPKHKCNQTHSGRDMRNGEATRTVTLN